MKMPAEKSHRWTGRWVRLALATLNDGQRAFRQSAAATIELAKFCARWSKSEQWGLRVGDHEMTPTNSPETQGRMPWKPIDYCAFSDEGKPETCDGRQPPNVQYGLFWQITDEGLQFRGGRGYEQGGSLKERGEKSISP